MKNIIEKIIESDATAKKIVNDALAEKDEVLAGTPGEIERMRAQAFANAEDALSIKRSGATAETAKKYAEMEQFHTEKLADFNRLYLAECEKWVDEIYGAVTALDLEK